LRRPEEVAIKVLTAVLVALTVALVVVSGVDLWDRQHVYFASLLAVVALGSIGVTAWSLLRNGR
jgi:hypothetical protein